MSGMLRIMLKYEDQVRENLKTILMTAICENDANESVLDQLTNYVVSQRFQRTKVFENAK